MPAENPTTKEAPFCISATESLLLGIAFENYGLERGGPRDGGNAAELGDYRGRVESPMIPA